MPKNVGVEVCEVFLTVGIKFMLSFIHVNKVGVSVFLLYFHIIVTNFLLANTAHSFD